jgi:hypothetical protein
MQLLRCCCWQCASAHKSFPGKHAQQFFFQVAEQSDTTIEQFTTGPNRETTQTPSVELCSWAMRHMSESVDPVEVVPPVRIGASYKKQHSFVRRAYTGVRVYTGIGYSGIYTGILLECGVSAIARYTRVYREAVYIFSADYTAYTVCCALLYTLEQ